MPHEKKYNPDWQVAKAHFETDLKDAVQTSDGPYAVGASGVLVTSTEHGWVPVVESGPAEQNSTLRTVDATSDGERIWFAGANGALGMYNVKEGRLHNYSYSGDITDSWRAVAVVGKAGQETALLTNDSGAILRFTVSGTDVNWGEPAKPGGGSTLTAIANRTGTPAYAADSNGTVYQSSDGKEWTKIGIPDAQVGFNDIVIGPTTVYVAANDGNLYAYNTAKQTWSTLNITNSAIRAVDIHGEHIVTLAYNNQFFWRTLAEEGHWKKQTAPTGKDLLDLALGFPDVAVGKAGSVVIRPPMEKPKKEKHEEKEKHKEKHKDPKTKAGPHPDPCPIILEELIKRLETDKLIELLKVKGCYTDLVETIKQTEERDLTKLLEETEILPLLLADVEGEHRHEARGRHEPVHHERVRTGRREHRGHHHHEHTARGGHAEELRAEELDVRRLRKLLGC